MTPSKTYLKFQETRSKEDLDTLNGYLLRLQQISVILDGDTELSNEEENKLYDEDETLTDKVLRLLLEIHSLPSLPNTTSMDTIPGRIQSRT